MTLTRTSSSLQPCKLNTVIALLLVFVSMVRGFPLDGQQLDSAVEGVQKYLESSGFPKMTRGEVLDFLNDFSKNSRVSRSDNTAVNVKKDITYVTPSPDFVYSKTQIPNVHDEVTKISTSRPKIPNGESPLNYGYPMSLSKKTDQSLPSTTPIIFVTVQGRNLTSDKKTEIMLQTMDARNAQKKSIGPSVDLNAYAKFKKIPEARNLKIDDDMKDFLNNFGLLDAPKSGKSIDLDSNKPQMRSNEPQRRPNEPQRRNDDATVTESVDEKLLKSILNETGNIGVNISQFQPLLESASDRGDHVFNPSESNIKTVDVNRIAKIVENIRLLADDNNTISLSQEAIQKKLENITADIAAIDQPTDNSNNKEFNGYEVFFDDNSKEVDSDLPESPTVSETQPLSKAPNPPDPLSTDELQMLLEKNKNEVKRQEPVSEEAVANITTSTEESIAVATSSEAVVASVSTDSSSEATSVEVTSGASAARDFSTTADPNPSLSQLAESFGGGETASSPPVIDEIITPGPERPKNGLYFYVDWNSFLTVNGGQKNQVNLRFAPKAGNPNHFIKVTVP
ncbi:uncharacterized protein LOC132948518 [Metopolophium dirhodum]|uniref:uncharacterized protein LOC132948518 n=1 Tax=Metopolophium dirhodum TaxID=44670 RepID=UPI002990630C|nr:uncharacterized protein LOC132948518 [Metopolophium dirhodum]